MFHFVLCHRVSVCSLMIVLRVVPLEYPTNVTVVESGLGSTGVELMWKAVSEDPDAVRGFFTGYRVPTDSFYSSIQRHIFVILLVILLHVAFYFNIF